MSDPMLLVGASLIAFGALLFLISFWKLISMGKPKRKFVVPAHEAESEQSFVEPSPLEEPVSAIPMEEPTPEPEPAPALAPVQEVVVPVPAKETPAPTPAEPASDKTVVMNVQDTEIQIQLDIIVSQLKNLNQKIGELEDRVENMPDATNTPHDIAMLKEPPVNPEDFTRKLLKLAEHVIVLEKEVARMKTSHGAKPPVMPL